MNKNKNNNDEQNKLLEEYAYEFGDKQSVRL